MKKIILLITLTLFSLFNLVCAENTNTNTNQKMKLILVWKSKFWYDQYLKVTPVVSKIDHIVFFDKKIEKSSEDSWYYSSFTNLDIFFEDGEKLSFWYQNDNFDSVANKKISKILLDWVETNTWLLIKEWTIQKAYDSTPEEKTYLELTKEYNTEKSNESNVDWKKLDSISAEIVSKVKWYDNYKDYLTYNKYFKKVLTKAQKTDKTFGEFYNEWIKFRYKIDEVLASWKVTSEYKLRKLYTIQTTINEMIDGLCGKIGWCGIGQDDAKKLKDIK